MRRRGPGLACVWPGLGLALARGLVLALSLSFVPAAPTSSLGAQTIRGTLVEADSGPPVPRAFIVLLDEQGQVHGSTLTSRIGSFVIRAPGSGRYRLRADRIGYASSRSPLLELRKGEIVEYTMAVTVQAVALSELEVRRTARCQLLPDEGLRIFRVWEEARKAMEASVWTGHQQYYRFDAVHFVNKLDRLGNQRGEVALEEIRYYGRHPFKSIGARDLALGGFVQLAAGSVSYFGPDADVMLSEDFLSHHCFRLVSGKDEREGMIGLEFEPVGDRRLTDISGTIWLDSDSAELIDLDYRYRNLNLPVSTKRLGGRVDFQRLPSGAWIVRQWYIRTPIIRFKQVRGLRGNQDVRPVLTGIDEGGGAVTAVYATGHLFEPDPADSLAVHPPPDSLIVRYPFTPRANPRSETP